MNHQIILLGKEITSVYQGIKEYGPNHIHLLYTEETKDVAEPIFPLLPGSILHNYYLTEPYNGTNVIEVCRSIHRKFTGDFAYNLSEGTKLMAFAAFTVAKETQSKAFYLTQNGEVVYLDNFEKHLLSCTLDNQEILMLNGNKLSEFHDAKQLSDEDISASLQIKQFIETHPQEHARIQKFFGIFCKRQIIRLPDSKVLANELHFKQRDGALLITSKRVPLLRLPQSNACHLYFEGRWWETLVANQVRLWSLGRKNAPEVWQSVIFRSSEASTQIKNEVDVLLNNEQKLIFLECKSGQVTQNDIYKVDAVRETYGGDISQAMLVSYYPLENSLREKCKDLQIYLFAPEYFEERINHLRLLSEWLDKLAEEPQI